MNKFNLMFLYTIKNTWRLMNLCSTSTHQPYYMHKLQLFVLHWKYLEILIYSWECNHLLLFFQVVNSSITKHFSRYQKISIHTENVTQNKLSLGIYSQEDVFYWQEKHDRSLHVLQKGDINKTFWTVSFIGILIQSEKSF